MKLKALLLCSLLVASFSVGPVVAQEAGDMTWEEIGEAFESQRTRKSQVPKTFVYKSDSFEGR